MLLYYTYRHTHTHHKTPGMKRNLFFIFWFFFKDFFLKISNFRIAERIRKKYNYYDVNTKSKLFL